MGRKRRLLRLLLSAGIAAIITGLVFLPLPAAADNGPPEEPKFVEQIDEEDPGHIPDPGRDSFVPPRFRGEEIETTLFDLYLGDRFHGTILADYTDSWFEVQAPEDIVEQLPGVRDWSKLMPLITGRVSKRREVSGIGSFHYDLRTFRIVLIPTPAFLETMGLDLKKTVPSPERGLGIKQNFGVAMAGEIDGQRQTAFSHNTVLSSGRYRAQMNASFVEDEPYEVTEAMAGAVLGTYQVYGGYLQAPGQSFASSLQYLGASMERSEDLIIETELTKGSKIEIYVPTRSEVRFYRGDRLLSVQTLDFGLQEIDTRAFPHGSYDVDISIIQPDGTVINERRFFTKSGRLVSTDWPVFSLSAGAKRNEFDIEDSLVYQTGVRLRAASFLEVGGSAYGENDFVIGNIETRGLYLNNNFSLGGAFSNRNDSGIQGTYSTQVAKFNFNLSATKTLNISAESKDDNLEIEDPDSLEPEDSVLRRPPRRPRRLTFKDQESISMGLGRSIGTFDLRYNTQRYETAGRDATFTHGPTLTWRIYADGVRRLNWSSSFYNTYKGRVASNVLSLTYRLNRALTWLTSLGYYYREDERDDVTLYNYLTYDLRPGRQRTTRIQLANELRRMEKKGSETKTQTEISESSIVDQLMVDHRGQHADLYAFVRDARNTDNDSTQFGVNAQSGVLVGPGGSVSISYPTGQEAVLVINLESRSSATDFDVLLNRQPVETMRAGQRLVLDVSPYQVYYIGVRPAQSAELVTYDSRTEAVTVFPGNIVTKKFKADKIFILLGRLVDEGGKPLAWERIRGTKEYTATEADGSFQAEISGNEALYVESRGRRCEIKLEIEEPPEYFIEAGDIKCQDNSAETRSL